VRLAIFRPKRGHGESRPGAWEDAKVYDLEAAWRAFAAERGLQQAAPGCLVCESGAFEALMAQAEWLKGRPDVAADVERRIEDVQLMAPIPHCRKLFALAGNYAEHIKEGASKDAIAALSKPVGRTPRVFMKPPSTTIIGPEEPILVPKVGQFIDWEVELGVVIGQRCKYVQADAAFDVIAGYTIVNDISERKLHIWERDETLEWDKFFDWLNGKWMDHFAPMGPCITPHADIGDPHDLSICLRVNGRTMQQSHTGDMIFSIPMLVEYISSIVTLEPGDVIATGTPAGVGVAMDPPVKLAPGDIVEAEVEKIGVLRNPVAAEV
jgi:2-keto-4-pentenoate hydratase/2-oxohepta-3-ene-1,7-dioic acid hydratase in catechol pathway